MKPSERAASAFDIELSPIRGKLSAHSLGGGLMSFQIESPVSPSGGPTVEYVFATDMAQSQVDGTYQAIWTSDSLASGCYHGHFHIHHSRVTIATVRARLKTGTAGLAGAVNAVIGVVQIEGSVTKLKLATVSPWTSNAVSRFDADQQSFHVFDVMFEVTSAGTITLEFNLAATATLTILKGSLVQLWKVS